MLYIFFKKIIKISEDAQTPTNDCVDVIEYIRLHNHIQLYYNNTVAAVQRCYITGTPTAFSAGLIILSHRVEINMNVQTAATKCKK